MNKTKTILLILTIFILLIFTLVSTAQAANLGDRTIRLGMRGNDVTQLQQKLNSLGFWSGNVDGIFGIKTKNAVINFQKSKKITADGIVGKKTLNMLNQNLSSRGSLGRFSQRDVELLARLVHAEAKGEPYIGKVAVAATVLNRLKDPKYPKSISSIIYQVEGGHYQYSPVKNGQINLVPDELSRKAVYEALSGADPTDGATTFYNPKKTSDNWVRSRPYSTMIGNHIFSK